MRPTRFGSKPSNARALTLFPEPDSPTRPRVSPGAIVYDRPRTAWTTLRPANSTRRLSTASNGPRVPARPIAVVITVASDIVLNPSAESKLRGHPLRGASAGHHTNV